MYTGNDFKERFKPREVTEIQEIGFIKKDNSWFADLPDYLEAGGTFESCIMVSGSDQLIEFLAQGEQYITLEVSMKPLRNEVGNLDYDVLLIRNQMDVEEHEDSGGATYQAILPKVEVFTGCWLCSVNTFVFGGTHPEIIFVRKKQ